MKIIIYMIILSLVSTVLAEEFDISATNTMKFGTGSEWAGDAKDIEIKKQYIQDYISVDASKGNFSLGFRYEAADLSEHNESLNEITKKYFMYSNNDITITAGDFYGTFGRGLVLDLKEEKADFFDSKITGGKVMYNGNFLTLQALGGKSYFKSINDVVSGVETVCQMDNAILGGETVLSLNEIFKMEDYIFSLGGSYLYMKGADFTDMDLITDEIYASTFIEKTEIGGISLSASAFNFDFFNEYAIKNTQRTPSKQGWANYTSLAYSTEGFGITVEFKDYYQYSANPNATVSAFTPYQGGPELTIDHSSHLLNSHPHEINPNDEIGYKFSILTQPLQNVDVSAIFAFASKHNEDSMIPETSDDYLPYIDSWMDGKYNSEKYNLTIGGGYMYDSPLSKDNNSNIIPGETDPDSTSIYTDERITFLGELHYELNENSSLIIAGEYQVVNNTNEIEDKEYNDMYVALEYAYPEYGYLNISLITTSEEVVGDSPDSWLGFEAGVNIFDNHKLELFYGRERAGIKCSGGACRQVPEFDGFRMTLISEF
ncbi:MAG: DUF6029 family protein [Candidatus Delongbacteria bacterium]|nr:DUF6029 family protein [Candidatus Delongbacteria bacterium]